MDTLKDEKDRGITIKSAAITLDSLRVRERVLLDRLDSLLAKDETVYRSPKTSAFSDSVASSNAEVSRETKVVFYLGNLPPVLTSAEKLKNLLTRERRIDILNLEMHAKRAYAFITVKEIDSEKVFGLEESTNGEGLIVQIAGDSPMKKLQCACEAIKINMPIMSILPKEKDGSYAYKAKATWPALGDVLIQAPGTYSSQKEGRQEIAKYCLEFLQSQKKDHSGLESIPESDVSVTSVGSDEKTTKDCFLEGSSAKKEAEEMSDEEQYVPLTINLIDSPGHIDFNAEVTSALRLSDGALVVVDAVEGMATQTRKVLKQALQEGVKPVLMLNKIDRLVIDRQLEAEEVYDRMQTVVDQINSFMEAQMNCDSQKVLQQSFECIKLSLSDGSVCFGSGYFGWSCSIETFVNNERDYDKRMAVRKYLSNRANFIQYIVRPILRMHRVCGVLPMKKKPKGECLDRIRLVHEILLKKVPGWSKSKLKSIINLQDEDSSTILPRKLLKRAMMAWMPAADTLVDTIAAHLPPPTVAQCYRARMLYSGSVEADSSGMGIYNCDVNASTVVYISKMGPSGPKKKGLLAFGRVFSGTLRSRDVLNVIQSDKTSNLVLAKIPRVKLCGFEGDLRNVSSVQAGELFVLEGVQDTSPIKAGVTLSSSSETKPIRHMNFAVTPIIQHSVHPKNKRDLTEMMEGLKAIVNADSTAEFYKDEETKELILAGAGELHIEVLVSSLLQNTGVEVELSEPIIAFRETVSSSSSEAALGKSANKHNRVWIKASPLTDEIVQAMSGGNLSGLDHKCLSQSLTRTFGWNISHSSRIWATGPEPLQCYGGDNEMNHPTCILVDSTFGLQIPDDAKANIMAAFLEVTRHGVLVNASMRGVRFDVVDAKFHQDSVHRRPNQVIPAASRAMYGAFLMASPKLLEPVCSITVNGDEPGSLSGAFSILGKRGGMIVDTASTRVSETVEAILPVRQLFGLAAALRVETHGRGHVSCVFDGMRVVPETEQSETVSQARLRKKLDKEVPSAQSYVDKL